MRDALDASSPSALPGEVMNSREILEAIIDSDDYGLSHAEISALRELDQLLLDCMEYVKVRVSSEATRLEERLAQAGYGEK